MRVENAEVEEEKERGQTMSERGERAKGGGGRSAGRRGGSRFRWGRGGGGYLAARAVVGGVHGAPCEVPL